MHTLSLLPAQIQNRVGLLQQQLPISNPSYSPYPTDTYDNFQQLPTTPTGNDSYTPSSAQGSAQPPAPSSEMSSNQQPIASPAYATPSAVPTSVPLWKNPVAWVVGGVGALSLGALTYFNLNWIKDKLGIGGNEGKLERAKTQFEALKTDFKNAKTDEEKKKIVTKMLAVLERNEGALLKDLPNNSLNAYATELKALKESGNEFAQTALSKAGKAIVKEAQDGVKTGSKDLVKAIKNSGTFDNVLRALAIPATLFFGGAFLSLTGWGGIIAGAGATVAGWVSTVGAPAISGAAVTAVNSTSVQIGVAGTVAGASAYTVGDPKPLKRFLSWIVSPFKRLKP